MNLKIISAAALGALVFFGVGFYVGLMQGFDTPPPPPLETPKHTEMIASLRRDNQSLKAEVDRLGALNASLSARRTPVPASAPTSDAAGWDALKSTSQQMAMLNNLRQIAAARDQFQLENGRPPASLDELVGETKYIRRMNSVDGENYSGLSLLRGQPMTVMTINGVSVTYDPEGGTTSRIAPPPTLEMARVMELSQRLVPAVNKAMEAYRAAHNGAKPESSNPEALIPYFATPQEGADFVEIIAAQKAARK